MILRFCMVAALLVAAPLLPQQAPIGIDPQTRNGEFLWFTLAETRTQLGSVLGKPAVVAEFGADFESWQYKLDGADSHEFSHIVVLRRSGAIVSITRNYDPEQSVDTLFPSTDATVYRVPGTNGMELPMRVRQLNDDVVAMAIGIEKAGQKTSQVVLIRKAELRYFYPWLFAQLQKPPRTDRK